MYSFPEIDASDIRVGIGIARRSSAVAGRFDDAAVRAFTSAGGLFKALREGEVEAVVRGELGAREFLEAVSGLWAGRKACRIALLSTLPGQPFLFAPIGIDEGETLEEKSRLVRYGRSLLEELGWPDRVGVLAGGRSEDRGRSSGVDRSLRQATPWPTAPERIAPHPHRGSGGADTLVLAPDGRAGNLIYRTLVHLGKGRSHGAVYFPGNQVVMDTSRAAPAVEYGEAVKLARFLAMKRDDRGTARI